ncbi:unnamed protein product [Coffea canephora]|uniref:DH200=94 genomic scaffold, scaffold_417 n=1 Tax=Coffea canephora TaxID=49390 RepID=A0A068VFI5_COFCA|nr:unnamed protein product [Coffea canephora]
MHYTLRRTPPYNLQNSKHFPHLDGHINIGNLLLRGNTRAYRKTYPKLPSYPTKPFAGSNSPLNRGFWGPVQLV